MVQKEGGKTLSFPLLYPKPVRVLYQMGVTIVFLFVLAFLWFLFYAVVTPLQTAIATSMTPFDVSNSTYPAYELANTFIENLWGYFLAVAIIGGLATWLYIYAQRKGVVAR